MVIGFFDLRLSGFERFPSWIWERHNALIKARIRYVYYYWQEDIQLNDVKKRLGDKVTSVEFVCIKHKDITELSADMCQKRIAALVFMAQRIPDNFVLLAAKKSKIITIMLQHGLYVKFMRRTALLFLENLRKTLYYLYLVIQIAEQINLGIFRTARAFVRHYIFGNVLGSQDFPNAKLNCDLVLVHGEYWKIFHQKQFGYKLEQQIVVGSHDFNNRNFDNNEYDVAVCYVAQTLVEDGRLSRRRMIKFVTEVLRPLSNRFGEKFVVKLHPRSDLSLYSSLSKKTQFERLSLPTSKVVIGHYSSLLVEVVSFTEKLCLYEFEKHETPEYLRMIASDIGLESNENKDFLLLIGNRVNEEICNSRRRALKEKLVNYFGNPEIDSLGVAADLIWRVSRTMMLPSELEIARILRSNRHKIIDQS